MKSMRFRKSLTRNWPGGRRNATVPKEDGQSSYPVFTHNITGFKKPYYVTPATNENGTIEDVSTGTAIAEGQLAS